MTVARTSRAVSGKTTRTSSTSSSLALGQKALSKHLSKGMKVAIEGKLRWSSWENQQGEKRSKLEVVGDDLEFMSSRDGGGAGFSGGASKADTDAAAPSIDDEEIPF